MLENNEKNNGEEVKDIENTVNDESKSSEGFEISSESDDYVSTIWTPYIPRFTEATEKRCYFADNSAADKAKAEAEMKKAKEIIVSEGNDEKCSSVNIDKSAESNKTEGKFNYKDPTAEGESDVSGVVVVNVNGKKIENENAINIFKFTNEKEKENNEIDEEENERREIEELTKQINHKDETQPVFEKERNGESGNKTALNIEEEVLKAEEASEKCNSELETYTIVPGIDKASRERRYSHVPEGYDKNSKALANDTSEYNSFSMRDMFKDKFLDSIMASRIRLAVAVLFGLCSLIFGIFKTDVCVYLGVQYNSMAPAVIDGCLIISLMLISMPETIKAFKSVIKGVVIPEFSASLVGIFLLEYSGAMIALSMQSMVDYPLFSSAYSIMVINAIFATHCLHNSNFAAFKIVSEKGNKEIIDKPFTRNLELENVALDGVVDEYKSRTASLYTTPFVSGFFGNIEKSSVNSKNNVIIIAASFGVAVITAVVMLIVKDAVSALSAFALIISLAIPAFSILSHKLTYKNAQSSAKLEKSAIIGEHALSDYADVDVITFDDTEVFGPDDVVLKSASDRRSDYVDTMRKMASLFAALGGPLCRVFESALNKKCAPAENVVIEDNGIEGVVDGKIIMAGNSEYMASRGIKVPADDDKKAGSTRTVYAASEGQFFATFTVHYSFSEEFALELSAMRENGIVPLVYTRDFNINNDFMKMLTGGNDVIRVMKKYVPVTEPVVYSKVNAAMVTFGGKSAAINLILASKRYLKFKSLVAITELASCIAGAAIALGIVISNTVLAVPSAMFAVWQICWSMVLAFMSKRIFNHCKKEKNNAD